MPDAPPPVDHDGEAEPGWHPDPHASRVLRWWDGAEWSSDAVKPVGEDEWYPAWHPAYLRERVRLAIEECAIWISARIWRG